MSFTGEDIVDLALKHHGERYILGSGGSPVPKNNPNWTGPWDCAEFASWCAYQVYGVLFGCYGTTPETADAYSGEWERQVIAQERNVDVALAIRCPGALLVRKPGFVHQGRPIKIGHVAISLGDGRTIEANSPQRGVDIIKNAAQRPWSIGATLPGVAYVETASTGAVYQVPRGLIKLEDPFMRGPAIVLLQEALSVRGYSPGPLDGVFGPMSEVALYAFQRECGVVADGIFGPETAARLGLPFPLHEERGGRIHVSKRVRPFFRQIEELVGELRAPSAGAAEDPRQSLKAFGPTPATAGYDITMSNGLYEAHPTDGRPAFYLGRETRYPSQPQAGQKVRTGLFQPSSDVAKLMPFGTYDRHQVSVRHPMWGHAIWPTVLAESSGYFGRINSYDRALYTFGFYQLAAHTPNENLILLFRSLLRLASAPRFFPDLSLKQVGGEQRVHVQRGVEWANLESENGQGELGEFMAYLNSDDQRVDDSETRASARLLDWMQLEHDARQTQVDASIQISRAKLKRTVEKTWQSGKPLTPRLAIWVNDIRHQGRGGTKAKTAIDYIRDALTTDDPETALRDAPGTSRSRLASVEKGLDDLKDDGFLSAHTYLDGDFRRKL